MAQHFSARFAIKDENQGPRSEATEGMFVAE